MVHFMSVYDCLVIGAGPAGLAYASTIRKQNSVLVVDFGKPVELRSQWEPLCLIKIQLQAGIDMATNISRSV